MIDHGHEDLVNSPNHYKAASGVQVLDLIEDLDYLRGNVIKYVFRAGKKRGADELEDLEKAQFYLDKAIDKLGKK